MHFIVLGLAIGLASGLTPGPLQTLVLSQAARFGWRAGAAVACAPLLSDAVIVAGTVGVIGLVPRTALYLISTAGALLVGYIAVDAWKASAAVDGGLAPAQLAAVGESEVAALAGSPSKALPAGRRTSFWQAALMNLLNPHAWLFWAIVGAPITLRATHARMVYGIFFVGAFYLALVGIKIVLAVLVARGVNWLGSGFQKWVLRGSAAGLALIAVLLLANGIAGLVR